MAQLVDRSRSGGQPGSSRRYDANGLEVLSNAECFDYLRRCTLGRVALPADGRVPIIPITYALDAKTIVFRTAPASKLLSASQGGHVTFEVDSADRETHTAWSVIAFGKAWQVHDAASIAHLKQLPIRRWVPFERPNWIRILVEEVSGRRIPG